MGYRAHVITKHREYGQQSFSDFEEFERLWFDIEGLIENDRPEEWSSRSEGSDYFEVSKGGLQAYIEHLSALPQSDSNEFIADSTNEAVIHTLKRAIDTTPDDYVSWEWF